VKLAPLTLLFVCAAPAGADVAVPRAKTWRDGCAARLDAAAKQAGLKPGARASLIPLRRENGVPNTVQYVEYTTTEFSAVAGDEPEPRPDTAWRLTDLFLGGHVRFRRLHNRFAKIEGNGPWMPFRTALDECLQMGESK